MHARAMDTGGAAKESILEYALNAGHLSVGKWWLEVDWPGWTAQSVEYAMKAGCDLPTFLTLFAKVEGTLTEHDERCFTIAAAGGGDLDVLKWVYAKWGVMSGGMHYEAAEGGHLHILQWLHANTDPEYGFGNGYVFLAAAAHGQLAVMEWWLDQGLPGLDEDALVRAAAHGQVRALEWLHARNCPYDDDACLAAASNGELAALQWLRARDYPWDWRSLYWGGDAAIESGDTATFDWMCAHGAPFDNVSSERLIPSYNHTYLWICARLPGRTLVEVEVKSAHTGKACTLKVLVTTTIDKVLRTFVGRACPRVLAICGVFEGRELALERTLAHYGIGTGDTIRVVPWLGAQGAAGSPPPSLPPSLPPSPPDGRARGT